MQIGKLSHVALAIFIGGGASMMQNQAAADANSEPLSIGGDPVMVDDESGFGPAIYREGHIVLH